MSTAQKLRGRLRALDLSCERTADVLDQMGILLDDRRPSFEDWLEGKLDGITPGIAGEVEAWLRSLRNGGPRARPRNIATVWHYANALRPILLKWSTNYDHLREVSRDDVLTALDSRHGAHRQHTLIALRSLFGFSKKNGVVFRNPTSRIRVGDRHSKLIQPLRPDQVQPTIGSSRDTCRAASNGIMEALALSVRGCYDFRDRRHLGTALPGATSEITLVRTPQDGWLTSEIMNKITY